MTERAARVEVERPISAPPPRSDGDPGPTPAADEDAIRVSSLELFFDLVFVFTITQLTTVLYRRPTGRGLLQVVLMLGVIWWMYAGYAWLTNAVAPDRLSRRALLLGSMASFLVLALAIPRAFSDSAVAFAIAYLAIVCVHAALYTRTSSAATLRSLLRLAPTNLLSSLVILAGAIAGGTAQYALWALAFVLEWSTPRLIDDSGFEPRPAHFVERHGLVVLIAIGESVVAIGIGAAGLRVDGALAAVVVVGLLLSAGLWWTYFGGDESRAEPALARALRERVPHAAVDAFGYWHLPILLGVVAIAAGERRAIGHSFQTLPFAQALALAGGLSAFLAGDVLFRRTLRMGSGAARAAAAALAPIAIVVGTEGSAFAELASLVALLAVALGVEGWAALAREGVERQAGPVEARSAAPTNPTRDGGA